MRGTLLPARWSIKIWNDDGKRVTALLYRAMMTPGVRYIFPSIDHLKYLQFCLIVGCWAFLLSQRSRISNRLLTKKASGIERWQGPRRNRNMQRGVSFLRTRTCYEDPLRQKWYAFNLPTCCPDGAIIFFASPSVPRGLSAGIERWQGPRRNHNGNAGSHSCAQNHDMKTAKTNEVQEYWIVQCLFVNLILLNFYIATLYSHQFDHSKFESTSSLESGFFAYHTLVLVRFQEGQHVTGYNDASLIPN